MNTLAKLAASPLRAQTSALERGLPASALSECASLVGMSSSRLARLLGCTRQPRGRYRLYTSEQLLRLARLRLAFSRLFGEQALAKMRDPVSGFGASALELAVTETGYHAVLVDLIRAAKMPVDMLVRVIGERLRDETKHRRMLAPLIQAQVQRI